MTRQKKPKISILLPTRGRTTALRESIMSLLNNAHDPAAVEILLAFDQDDVESFIWFQENVIPELNKSKASYECFGFLRIGYLRLNEYVNTLAGHARGQWLMFWGDDAVMQTAGWDKKILAVKKFRVLRMPTHNQHPYAIFPIVPREWYELFGYISPHQLTDTWVSQVGYIIDIIQNVNISVLHDRFDITGNNNDETWQNRPMLEGNPEDPRDFNHVTWTQRRWNDCETLTKFLRKQGEKTTWFDRVKAGKQDPWEKMCSEKYDPNHQVSRR